jgi:hypothetical protein
MQLHIVHRHKGQHCALVQFVAMIATHMMLLQVIVGVGADDMNIDDVAAESK